MPTKLLKILERTTPKVLVSLAKYSIFLLFALLPSLAFATETISNAGTFGTNSPICTATISSQLSGASFTPASNEASVSGTINLAYHGTATYNVQIAIQADSTGLPSGTNLGTASISASSITSSSGANVSFGTITYNFVAGTKYWEVVGCNGSTSDTNYYRVGLSATPTSPSGLFPYYYQTSGTWTNDSTNWAVITTLNFLSASTSIPPIQNWILQWWKAI